MLFNGDLSQAYRKFEPSRLEKTSFENIKHLDQFFGKFFEYAMLACALTVMYYHRIYYEE